MKANILLSVASPPRSARIGHRDCQARRHSPKIAAKVDPADQSYFEDEIAPLPDHALVEFVGEIDDHAKAEFLGRALALILPIDWPEPFGLVMIEAMSAGTPVIAYRSGSVPEIVTHGVTGYIVDPRGRSSLGGSSARELETNRRDSTSNVVSRHHGWPKIT